jgi:SAM-dependent methyltransferase
VRQEKTVVATTMRGRGRAATLPAMHTLTPHDRYWLGDGAPVAEHLLAQAEVYAVEATELLDRIGVPKGAETIDVACGALGILPLLGERVGPAGRVVGLDIEPRLLALARELAAGRGLAVETVEADARATGLPAGSFNLVHARTLLINLTRPEEAVAEMARLARPGGVVALQEPDTAAWVCDPPHRAFDVLRDEVRAVYPRTGRDFDMGRRLGRLLRDAGLRDVEVRPTARATRPGDYYHTFLLTLCGMLREEILAGRRLTPDRLDSDVAELRDHLAQPGAITCQPTLWQAWAVKP